jgi:hypothetical protein
MAGPRTSSAGRRGRYDNGYPATPDQTRSTLSAPAGDGQGGADQVRTGRGPGLHLPGSAQ